MQATQVTFFVDGSIETAKVELPAFTRRCIMSHLGVAEADWGPGKDVMSNINRRDDGSFVVSLAQDKPWTYIRHVFVA